LKTHILVKTFVFTLGQAIISVPAVIPMPTLQAQHVFA
jgi:hypothetical protein